MQTMYEVDSYRAFRQSSELVVNPEFKKFIPKLSDDEYNGLVESLKREGCRDPIIISGRTIVDGHNRYEICNRYNIPFKTVQMEFSNQNEIKIWMIQNQFSRRNLTTYQRARLALELEPLFVDKAKENQGRGKKISLEDRCKSADKAGKLAEVHQTTVHRAKKIIKHATPEIINALDNNEISLNCAYTNMFKNTKIKAKTFNLPTKLVNAINSVYKHPEFQHGLEKALDKLVKDIKNMK